MTPLVAIANISHSFGAGPVLSGVSLSLARGSYTVLLGPSGSGKTTLLSILGGFLAPDEGSVLINGVDCTRLAPARRPTATVFQDYALFPHLTAGANVGFGLRMKGVARTERDGRARTMLEVVGLAAAFHKKPHQLSGGQRQRVALARALLVEPAVLLLDEPLGALDLKLRRQMQDELKAIQRRVGTAFVHVTHDQEEAMALADHLVVMNNGQIEDQGPPERVYHRPQTRFTATFMGESTVLSGHTIRDGIDTPIGWFPAPPGTAALAIRPEHVALGGSIPARITDVVFQGSFKRVSADVAGVSILARLPAETMVSPGDMVKLAIDTRHMIPLRA
ncbi:ABC transporter ATP-binding protein [Aestuariivirga sp.]|jgi:spermidine/putrescine transport system ATP-binding protein|uniref:ABC transporter ATP-binding protein n=1 Tax=Aestuariivirga sp. TaxID=2650926 RepID=UPI0037833A82